jgi:uncharacterized protein YxjI
MSDENKTYKLPHVPAHAIINFEVSGTFLKKCQTLLLAISEKMGKEKVTASLTKFRDTNAIPDDTDEATLFIMTAIVGSIEKAAIEQKKVEVIELTAEQLKKEFGPTTGN